VWMHRCTLDQLEIVEFSLPTLASSLLLKESLGFAERGMDFWQETQSLGS